ncbi:uncharacterized protein [Periplaneta americana]|uniref:uncharacterized protein n=1 Tax=Periplaneta americana TaxID=6978 RepID=UPI0037E78A5C
MYEKLKRTCKALTQATDEDLEFIYTRSMPTTRKGNCTIGCMFQEMGYLKNCDFTLEVCYELAERMGYIRATAEELYENCRSCVKNGDGCCDNGSRLWKCLGKHSGH